MLAFLGIIVGKEQKYIDVFNNVFCVAKPPRKDIIPIQFAYEFTGIN